MKKTRFTETQTIKAFQEHENVRKAEDVCREFFLCRVFLTRKP